MNRRGHAKLNFLFHDTLEDWVRDKRQADDRNHVSADGRPIRRQRDAEKALYEERNGEHDEGQTRQDPC